MLKANDNQWGETMIRLGLGFAAKYSGHLVEARTQFTTLESLLNRIGDKHRLYVTQSELAHIERFEEHHEAAERLYRQTIVEWQNLGHRAAVANQLECLAFIAKFRQQARRAATLLGAAENLRETIEISMSPVEREEYDREVAELRSQPDQPGLAAAWAGGRAMNIEQTIAFALEQ